LNSQPQVPPAALPADARGFRWFETVDEAFQVMLPAIEGARVSVRLESYIYSDAPIGVQIRDALARACQRGVRVQVLVDALGSLPLPEKFWDPLAAAGGDFRWFNPIKLQRLGFRDHRKMLVVDETAAIVGGFNISPEYQGDGLKKGWHDLGLQVPEPLARALAESFDVMFSLADRRHSWLERYRRNDISRLRETAAGQLLTNAPGRGKHWMREALMRDIATAPAIDLISAYFLPPLKMRRALAQASREGRRVRLILAGQSDVRIAQLAARYLYNALLRAGVEIYEYEPQILHTKFYLFGDAFYVGSANLDKRSLLVNYELLVRVRDTELAAYGRNFFDRALANCRRIDPAKWKKSRGFWTKLQEKWGYFVLSKIDPYLTQLQLRVLRREWLARNKSKPYPKPYPLRD